MSAYTELDGEQQVALHGEVAERALGAWGMEGATLELLKHRENTVYKVVDRDGTRFVMRIHRPDYHSDGALHSEFHWLTSLREAGVATTETVPCADGAPFARVVVDGAPDGRQVDILRWVEGEPMGTFEEGVHIPEPRFTKVYETVGEQAALIHNHGEHWQKPEGFERLVWDENEFFGGPGSISGCYSDLESLTGEQRALLEGARQKSEAAMKAFGKAPDRYGLVHGDLLPENVFVRDDDGIQLIDWDDTGFGWHVYDFVTALLPHIGQETHGPALDAMVRGYRRRRDLPDEHLEMIPYISMARGLAYVGWAHSRGPIGAAIAPEVVAIACWFAGELPD